MSRAPGNINGGPQAQVRLTLSGDGSLTATRSGQWAIASAVNLVGTGTACSVQLNGGGLYTLEKVATGAGNNTIGNYLETTLKIGDVISVIGSVGGVITTMYFIPTPARP